MGENVISQNNQSVLIDNTGVWFLTGTLMVSLIHEYTGKGGGKNWIPNRNLNNGRLEYYYLFVSGLQLANLIYYMICTKFYTYKALEEASEGGMEAGDAELTTNRTPSGSMGDGHDNGETMK